MNSEIFGYAPDGQVVHRLTISNGPLTAKIINWGAAIQDLRMEGPPGATGDRLSRFCRLSGTFPASGYDCGPLGQPYPQCAL
ncbi:hypothetical protein BCBD1442_16190 [Brucella ceti]|nr:hypothetical protein BCBD1442_16190 [Brucella ceti]